MNKLGTRPVASPTLRHTIPRLSKGEKWLGLPSLLQNVSETVSEGRENLRRSEKKSRAEKEKKKL